jgi:hypothetical protein
VTAPLVDDLARLQWLHGLVIGVAERRKLARDPTRVEEVEETAMSSTGSTGSTGAIRCEGCHDGDLTPTHLTITLSYNEQSFSLNDDDALVCNGCGGELIGERAMAFLLT